MDDGDKTRIGFIGGSDIGVIMGMSKWSTPYDLWLRKTKRDTSQTSNISTRAGHALEELILNLYVENTKRTIATQVPLRHQTYPQFTGTADAICYDAGIIIDAKASADFGAWKDGPPATVVCQMNWYMNLANMSLADVALLSTSTGWSYSVFRLERDQDLIDRMIQAALDFWECCVKDTPPPATCHEDVMALYPNPEKGSYIVADQDVIDLIKRWSNLHEQVKAGEAEKKSIRDRVAIALGNHDEIVDHDGNKLVKTIRKNGGREIRILG